MPHDPLKKVVKGNGDKRRQQLVIGGTLALVLIAYLTYRKMGKGGGAVASGAPAGVTTATNVPSGTPAPDTTVPFAAPADTTGGGTVQTGSSTNAPGAPSSTQAQGTPSTPPVKAPPALADRAKTDPPIPNAPHPAIHPALSNPVVPTHPMGKADAGMPGASDYKPLASPVHPITKAGR